MKPRIFKFLDSGLWAVETGRNIFTFPEFYTALELALELKYGSR